MTINTLADECKLAYQSLLKLEKYEGLLYNEECKVSEIQHFTNTHKNIEESKKSKSMGKNIIDKTSKTYTYLGTCWKCNEFGHLSK